MSSNPFNHPLAFFGDEYSVWDNGNHSIFSTLNNKINVNVKEHDTYYAVSADLPGIPKENIKISTDKSRDSVTISVFTNSERNGTHDNYTLFERFSGSSSRSIPFRRGSVDWVRSNNQKASLENGVLRITINKVTGDDPNDGTFNTIKIE